MELLGPWLGKVPEPAPERLHTTWAHPGWRAWNQYAVEVEVANFLGSVARDLPAHCELPDECVVIETGTGQGFITRALDGVGPEVRSYESDSEWREHLKMVIPYTTNTVFLEEAPSPSHEQMNRAHMVILDSNDPWRMAELAMWNCVAPRGSILFVHDAGNGHPSWDGHYTLGQLIRTLQIPGQFLENPRGSFIASRDHQEVPVWILGHWGRELEKVWSRL